MTSRATKPRSAKTNPPAGDSVAKLSKAKQALKDASRLELIDPKVPADRGVQLLRRIRLGEELDG